MSEQFEINDFLGIAKKFTVNSSIGNWGDVRIKDVPNIIKAETFLGELHTSL